MQWLKTKEGQHSLPVAQRSTEDVLRKGLVNHDVVVGDVILIAFFQKDK